MSKPDTTQVPVSPAVGIPQKLILAPVGPALVAVGKDMMKSGHSAYILVPTHVTWKMVIDESSKALNNVQDEFNLGSQPRADPDQPLRQLALSLDLVNIPSSSSSQHERLPGLPIRIWSGVQFPRIPPKKENAPPPKLKQSALASENTRSPFILTIHAHVLEKALPAVTAAVRLGGIDGTIEDPEELFNNVEIIWDTGAPSSIISDEMFSDAFRQYLKLPVHDPYRSDTGVKILMDGEIRFSNTIVRINCVCLVVPTSAIPNQRVGILLGQRGAIDRIIYTSVPRANFVARGLSLPPNVWGDLVLEEYVDQFDEIHRF